MDRHATSHLSKLRRRRRVRSTISGTAARPRLSVRKTVKHVHVQLIDDVKGQTLVHVSDVKMKGTKSERAVAVGQALAEAAKLKKITHVTFDRGSSKYQGRMKALADAARSGGLIF